MTTQESDSRDRRLIENIRSVLNVTPRLMQYATAISVSIENASVVLRGELPHEDLRPLLVPAVRQAGVLYRVSDFVQIES